MKKEKKKKSSLIHSQGKFGGEKKKKKKKIHFQGREELNAYAQNVHSRPSSHFWPPWAGTIVRLSENERVFFAPNSMRLPYNTNKKKRGPKIFL